ncbi:hypothetical protein Tcan_05522 [Toxocara canis]|uniref:Uncharacterized protein n=1 Tax=Toxocara canis TaxID=6265 RepID=A0A0B2V9R9_TOXCA|nr:hypothetical protein Tcan_05522 [Toxocara canis]
MEERSEALLQGTSLFGGVGSNPTLNFSFLGEMEERSKALVQGTSLFGGVGSNPTLVKPSDTGYSSEFSSARWKSGLRRWFKAPVSSEAWVRIPLSSNQATQDIAQSFPRRDGRAV